MNIYRALQEELRPTADGAVAYFKKEFGISAIKIEEELDPDIDFRPTLHGVLPDKHILCVEVCDALLPPLVDRFILACRNKGLPVKLFVVLPKNQLKHIDTKQLSFLQENGIAVLEVSPDGTGRVLHGMPLSMSLTGLRHFSLTAFPPKYRGPLSAAIAGFKQGDPAKGCSQIYDEIEALTRRVAHKCSKIPKALRKTPNFDIDKESWANVLEFLKVNLDRSVAKCPDLSVPLVNRLIALTPHRNDTGHKPSTVDKLVIRDRQLRTRFEAAIDDLHAFVRAVQPLRV